MTMFASTGARASKARENSVALLVTAGAAIAVTGFIVARRTRTKRNKPWKMIPGWVPLLGHAHLISSFEALDQQMQEWIDEYGDPDLGCFEIDLAGDRWVVVFTEERLKEVLKHRPRLIHRSAGVAKGTSSIEANGVFSAEGSVWTQERKLVSAALNEKNLKDYLSVFKAVTDRLVAKWKNQCANPIAIEQDLVRSMADVIARVSMGRDYDFLNHPDSMLSKDIQATMDAFANRALSWVPYWKIPFIGQYIDGYGSSIYRVNSLINRAIDEEMSSMDTIQKQDTFLHKLFAVMNSERCPLARDRVWGNILTLFLAGTETTSNTLLVAFYLLAEDESLQKDLWLQVKDLDLETITLSDLIGGLPLLKSFLHEVHRWYGTFLIGLQAIEDVPFCDTIAPKGTQFMVMQRYMSISPNATANDTNGVPPGPLHKPSHEFCARRWLVPGEADGSSWTCNSPGITNVSFMPFGYGVRSCPGRAYSEALSILAIAKVLQTFTLSLPPGHPKAKFISKTTMVPDCQVRIVMTPRNRKTDNS